MIMIKHYLPYHLIDEDSERDEDGDNDEYDDDDDDDDDGDDETSICHLTTYSPLTPFLPAVGQSVSWSPGVRLPQMAKSLARNIPKTWMTQD